MYVEDIKQWIEHIAPRYCNIVNCRKPILYILYDLCSGKIVVPAGVNVKSPMSIAYYKLDTLVYIHDHYYFFKLAF